MRDESRSELPETQSWEWDTMLRVTLGAFVLFDPKRPNEPRRTIKLSSPSVLNMSQQVRAASIFVSALTSRTYSDPEVITGDYFLLRYPRKAQSPTPSSAMLVGSGTTVAVPFATAVKLTDLLSTNVFISKFPGLLGSEFSK